MSPKKYRRLLLRKLAEVDAQIADESGQPATQPAVPPPPAVKYHQVAQQPAPQLWHFSHQRPGIAGILYCVVQATDIQNARGAAYLIAEQFSENVIGFIKAGSPPNLPHAG